MDETTQPKVAVSLAMKVNLGNYESADLFLSVADVLAGTTEAEIDAALETGKLAYEHIRMRLRDQINDVRAKYK